MSRLDSTPWATKFKLVWLLHPSTIPLPKNMSLYTTSHRILELNGEWEEGILENVPILRTAFAHKTYTPTIIPAGDFHTLCLHVKFRLS